MTMILQKKLKKLFLSLLIIASLSNAGEEASSPSSAASIGEGLVTGLLTGNLDLNGLIGQFLNFGIPGAGRVQLNCKEPDFNFPKLDLCGLSKGIGLKIPTFPDFGNFGFNIGGCSIGLDFANNSSIESCQRKRFDSFCDTDNTDNFNLNDYKNGIGSNSIDADRFLSIMGGKGIFGKDTCAQDPKRYSGWQMGDPGYSHPDIKAKGRTTSMAKIISGGGEAASSNASTVSTSDSLAAKVLFDKEIGGDPKFLNTRRAADMFRCVEAAKKNGLDSSECNFNSENPGSEKADYEIEAKLAEKATYDMGPISKSVDGKYGDKVDKYWKLFADKSKKENISDWKMLMAIGMVESGLDPTAQGAPNSNGSRDYGMMQVNSVHKKAINERYGAYGGFWQALNLPEIAVDYGAKVFGDCQKKFGATWKSVDCYNKGAGNAQDNSAYAQKVKQEYQKLGGKDFGDPDSPYTEDVKISQRISAFAAMSEIATTNKRTLTHLGMDTVKLLPLRKQAQYIEMVDRHIAQKTFILAAYKKAGDIEKAIYHINDYGSGISRGATLPETTTTASGGGI